MRVDVLGKKILFLGKKICDLKSKNLLLVEKCLVARHAVNKANSNLKGALHRGLGRLVQQARVRARSLILFNASETRKRRSIST